MPITRAPSRPGASPPAGGLARPNFQRARPLIQHMPRPLAVRQPAARAARNKGRFRRLINHVIDRACLSQIKSAGGHRQGIIYPQSREVAFNNKSTVPPGYPSSPGNGEAPAQFVGQCFRFRSGAVTETISRRLPPPVSEPPPVPRLRRRAATRLLRRRVTSRSSRNARVMASASVLNPSDRIGLAAGADGEGRSPLAGGILRLKPDGIDQRPKLWPSHPWRPPVPPPGSFVGHGEVEERRSAWLARRQWLHATSREALQRRDTPLSPNAASAAFCMAGEAECRTGKP